jgi:predicted DCC family thiol-disulfide oxidoreductase YuxK
MNAAYPLMVYFDASCPLCNSEMQNIKLHDTDNRLVLVDCSAPGFDDKAFQPEGITRALMLERLHVHDAQGAWFKGVAAFEVIYHAAGMAAIAKLWGHPLTRPWAEWAYPWVARHRQLLSAFGLHKLFNLWSRHAARKSNRRGQACRDGNCAIPPGADGAGKS